MVQVNYEILRNDKIVTPVKENKGKNEERKKKKLKKMTHSETKVC